MRYEVELSTFLANETTLFLGTTLQHGRFIETSPKRCTAIIFNQVSNAYFDLPDRIDVVIEATSRSDSYEGARDDAEEIYNALHRRIHKDLPVITSGNELIIQTSECQIPPQWVGIDENKRNMWSATYLLRIKIKE